MLAGVNDEGKERVGALSHRSHDWRDLHEVGPGTDDVYNLQHFLLATKGTKSTKQKTIN
jgi:hypothetical protein